MCKLLTGRSGSSLYLVLMLMLILQACGFLVWALKVGSGDSLSRLGSPSMEALALVCPDHSEFNRDLSVPVGLDELC